jgi:hypothetical protein
MLDVDVFAFSDITITKNKETGVVTIEGHDGKEAIRTRSLRTTPPPEIKEWTLLDRRKYDLGDIVYRFLIEREQ